MKESNKNKSKPTTKAGREAKKLSPRSARSPKQQKLLDEKNKILKETKIKLEQDLEKLAQEKKKKLGRPPIPYDEEMATELLEEISSTTRSIDNILVNNEKYPSSRTIFNWIKERPDFAQRYDEARRCQAQNHVDSLFNIVNDESRDRLFTVNGEAGNSTAVARDRLKVDTIKWFASKLIPKVYGDRTFNETQLTVVKHEEFLDILE